MLAALKRVVVILAGLALIGAMLFQQRLLLDGFSIGSTNWFLVVFLGLLLSLIGLLGERFSGVALGRGYATTAVIILNTLLALMVIELLFTVFQNARSAREQLALDFGEFRANLPYYQNTTWGEAHWAEVDFVPTVYEPFTIWQQGAFEGETLTMLADGSRLVPGAQCTEDAYTVFVLGGSTVWGLGAPDEGTIPAYIQASLDGSLDVPVCVRNLGVPGYVSTQSVLDLVLAVQAGQVPDLVIIYDGLNDVFATFQNRQAGLHQNYTDIVQNIERDSLGAAFVDTLRRSNTVQTLARGGRPLEPLSSTEIERLALETARVYQVNVSVVDGLAQDYGFEYGFFWQPVMPVGQKPLTEVEQQYGPSLGPEIDQLYITTYEEMARAAEQTDNLYYIADVFDDVESFIWIDPFHIVPEGNERVAAHILDLLDTEE